MTHPSVTVTAKSAPQGGLKAQPYLSFRLSPKDLGMVATGVLVEVIALDAAQVIAIPDMPQHVMGVYNCRGEVVWLVNGEAFFGLSRHTVVQNAILIRQDDRTIGFAVHSVEQMLWCNTAEIEAPRMEGGEAIDRFSHWVRGEAQAVLVLDVDALFVSSCL
jgi:positive phototaxis protein PixI